MAERLVELFVAGEAQQQGSKSATVSSDGKAVMFEQNKRLGPWRTKVKQAAQKAWRDEGMSPIPDPVQVTVEFRLPQVPSDPDRHWVALTPDIDKLERALYDGLKAGKLLLDDRLVVKHLVSKRYVEHGEEPGVMVTIDSLGDHERMARERRMRQRIRP